MMYIFLNIKCFAFNIFAVKLLIYILFLLLPVQVLQRIKVPTFAVCDTNQNYDCHGSISSVDIYIVNYIFYLITFHGASLFCAFQTFIFRLMFIIFYDIL